MRRKTHIKYHMVLFILMLSLFSVAPVKSAGNPAAMERGEKLIYPADLGEHFTYFYQVEQKPAYCLQSSVKSPESGTYTGNILEENEDLRQVLYYGYGGPGDISAEFYPEYSDEVRYILTHLAASYIYCGDAALKGCTDEGMETYRVRAYIAALLEKHIPEGKLCFSCEDRKCFREGNIQRTQKVRLEGPAGRAAEVSLPEGVTLRFVGAEDTAVVQKAHIQSKDSFYLEFPLDAKGEFSLTASAESPKNDWKLVILTTGEKTQDIGYGEYIPGEQENFAISFERQEYYPALLIAKTDAEDGSAVPGAEFVLKDEEGKPVDTWISTDRLHRMEMVKPGKYVLEEISAPTGYVCMEPKQITVESGVPRVTVKAENKRLYGKIIIQKRDKDNRNPLLGVQFAILDKETQEVLEVMETDEKGIAQSSPLPIWKYENGTAKEKITYLVREIRPADGYQKPETDVEADCTEGKVITDVQELYIEWENERIKPTPTPSPSPSPSPSSTPSPSPSPTPIITPSPSPTPTPQQTETPKTGDESAWEGYGILMVFVSVSTYIFLKKRYDFI